MSDDINRSEWLARLIRKAAGKHDDPKRSVEGIISAMADRIEALEAENARLRGALTQIGLHCAPELSEIVRAALENLEKDLDNYPLVGTKATEDGEDK